MRILLDTHILIWLHTDRSLLSHKALDILQTAGNDFFLQLTKYLGSRIEKQQEIISMPDFRERIT